MHGAGVKDLFTMELVGWAIGTRLAANLALDALDMACDRKQPEGNCWDNAPMESFFATFKTELVYQQRFATREEARRAIFEYIEVFYNRQRRHASIGNVAPAEFERRCYASQVAA